MDFLRSLPWNLLATLAFAFLVWNSGIVQRLITPPLAASEMGSMESIMKHTFLDVREWNELRSGAVKGALFFPSSELGSERSKNILKSLKKDEEVWVYCRSGNRSARVTSYLNSQGIKAKNVGGFENLRAQGLPTEVPQAPRP